MSTSPLMILHCNSRLKRSWTDVKSKTEDIDSEHNDVKLQSEEYNFQCTNGTKENDKPNIKFENNSINIEKHDSNQLEGFNDEMCRSIPINIVENNILKNTSNKSNTDSIIYNTIDISSKDHNTWNTNCGKNETDEINSTYRTPPKKIENNKLDLNSPKIEDLFVSPALSTPLSITKEYMIKQHGILAKSPLIDKDPQYFSNELSENKSTDLEKRTFNADKDFHETIKLETSSDVNFNDFQVDLLHDINTVMNFEESKITTDMLTSSMLLTNTMRGFEENNVEIKKEPSIDPLFISENEEENVDNTPNFVFESKCKSTPSSKSGTEKNLRKRKRIRSYVRNEKSNDASKKNTSIADNIINELNSLKKKEGSISNDINKLSKLGIKLIHNVPLQHTVETYAGSHVPTQAQKKLFTKYGPLRKGKFSPSEDEIIINNWTKFCELHGWDVKNVKPFLYLKHEKVYYIPKLKERLKFVQFLANGLPWRTLYSVYYRFRNIFSKRKNNRYNKEEDSKIIAHMQNKTLPAEDQIRKCADLGKLLNRSRHSIWLRYQILKRTQVKEKSVLSQVTWTLPLIRKYIQNLLKITLSEDVAELKDAVIPKVVWQKLEVKMNVDHVVLKDFWLQQLHMQLFCPNPIYLNDIKIQLIEYMYGKGISHIREIIWPNVAKYFDGVTTTFLCKVFFYLWKEISLKIETTNFCDIIEYMYAKYIPRIINQTSDKYLPRIKYINGKVEIVKYKCNE